MQVIWACIVAGKFPNASDLARALEVSSKAIHRDIEFMRDQLGFPIRYEGSRFGYCVDVAVPESACCPFCGNTENIAAAIDIPYKPESLKLQFQNGEGRGIRDITNQIKERDEKLKLARRIRNDRISLEWHRHDAATGTAIRKIK